MEDQAVGRTDNRGNEGGGTGGGTQHKGAGPSPSPQPTHGGHQTAEGSNTAQSAPGGQQQHSGAGRKPPPNSTHPVGNSGTRRGGGGAGGGGSGGGRREDTAGGKTVATTTPRPEAVAARYKNRSWRTTSPNGLARRMVMKMVVSKTSTTTTGRKAPASPAVP
jgi:hypothetical protein